MPSETSVSIVAAPWRAPRSAARWNSRPLQKTTGVASTSETHSQPEKRSGGIIESRTSGTESASAPRSRSGVASWSCVCAASAGAAW